MRVIGFFLFLFFASCATCSEYQEARKHASENKKVLIIAALSGEKCPWSRKLTQEILDQKQFYDALQGIALFSKVDCSQELVDGLQEVPVFQIFSPSGEEIAQVGYLPLEPTEYGNLLREKIEQWQLLTHSAQKETLELGELRAIYEKAVSLDKQKEYEHILLTGLEKDETGTYFLLERYALLIAQGKKIRHSEIQLVRKRILERAPQNEEGTLRQLAILDFQLLSKKLKKKYDPIVAVQPLLDYLTAYGEQDREHVWKIHMMISQHLLNKGRQAEALTHLEACYEAAPEAEKPSLADTLRFLRGKR